MEDRVAVVTGGAQGMGRAIALRLARDGADVAIFDLQAEMMREAAEQVEALGRRCLPLVVDVADPLQVEAAVGEVLGKLRQVDVLVNNAGVGYSKPFLQQTPEDWQRIYAINLFGPVHCCRAVLPQMVARRKGSIVNLGSTAGKTGRANITPYCSSKAAVINLTQSLALEFAPYGIRVNAVCPDFVLTEFWRRRSADQARALGITPEEVIRQRAATIPLGRPQTPEEVASVVAFLASDEAGAMTGQAINVSGGHGLL